MILATLIAATRPGSEIPVPDGDEARLWAEQELSRPIYQEAQATWFDRAAHAVATFVRDLFTSDGSGATGPLALVALAAVLIALTIIVALLAGRPRRARAQRRPSSGALGYEDQRSAAQLRTDAERAAARQDWGNAVILRFRALVQDLQERDLIEPIPGATAQQIAREASASLSVGVNMLPKAATVFDDVRYRRIAAHEELYRFLTATDEQLRTARPRELV